MLIFLGVPVTLISWWQFHRLYTKGAIDRQGSPAQVNKSLKAMKMNYSEQVKAQKQERRFAKWKKKRDARRAATQGHTESQSELIRQQEIEKRRELKLDIEGRSDNDKEAKEKMRGDSLGAMFTNPDDFDGAEYIQSSWMKFGGGFYGLTALWTFFALEIADFIRLIFDWSAIAALFRSDIVSLVVDFFINQFTNIITSFVWFTYWGEDSSILLCFIIAYGAYLLGMQLARRSILPDPEMVDQYRGEAIGRWQQSKSRFEEAAQPYSKVVSARFTAFKKEHGFKFGRKEKGLSNGGVNSSTVSSNSPPLDVHTNQAPPDKPSKNSQNF